MSRTGTMEMKDSGEGEEEVSPGLKKELKPLLARDLDSREDPRSLYMTPYSIRFLSHPVCAWMVWALGMILFIFAFIGLFITVNDVSCMS